MLRAEAAVTRDLGLLILRLAGLYLAVAHGWGKIVGLASGETRFLEGVARIGFPMPLAFAWAAALSEFLGGLAIALGLFTRWVAPFAAFTMFVAAFGGHRALSQFLAWLGLAPASEELKKWGNPELAFVYMLICLAVALLGPGRFSVDSRLGRK
jgi:putative oxidoreductase